MRLVLDAFDTRQGAISLPQLARELGIERTMLETMIEHWVRKGKLRESGAAACTTCGSASGCPFVVAMPRSFERVRDDAPVEVADAPPAACGCGKCH
ncbi:MAG: hypothetical protein IPK19_41000 [Chloroflexi bacterium]|nr:hypothetical protein [Chloroflexota bacterium]